VATPKRDEPPKEGRCLNRLSGVPDKLVLDNDSSIVEPRRPRTAARLHDEVAGRRYQELERHTEKLAAADPDTLVREAAGAPVGGEDGLKTLPSLAMMERIVFLRRVPIFVNLAPADLMHVAQAADEHAFPDGALIAGQGEPGEEMHVIASGCIRVLVARGDERIEVARRMAGECVGEMAIVSRAARMASLVAEGEVRTLTIDKRRFERILRDRPDVSLAVMGVLSDRLRELHGAEPPEVRS
jgi:CRP/FNR family transcriptional regulator, cyclic AMP receptor protein